MAKKVDPRSIDNSLPRRTVPSASWPRFVCRFHIRGSLITVRKLIQYIWFPRLTASETARQADHRQRTRRT